MGVRNDPPYLRAATLLCRLRSQHPQAAADHNELADFVTEHRFHSRHLEYAYLTVTGTLSWIR